MEWVTYCVQLRIMFKCKNWRRSAEAPQEEEEEEETGSYINPVGTAQKHITSDPANEFSANEFSANEDLFCCFSNSANEYGFG